MIRAITTFGYVGLMRPAPGTWGSAAALPLALLIDRYAGFPALFAATVAVTLLGLWACSVALRGRPGEDPAEIVIDEVAGMWLTLCFASYAFWSVGWEGWMPWPAWVAGFALFRLFDIWKPGPAGWADRRGDAGGVMLDDLWAAVMAGVGVVVLGGLWHLVMM
ncbi:MAG: phosphatidylglycerophosphatase A [Gemmobacter sp.]